MSCLLSSNDSILNTLEFKHFRVDGDPIYRFELLKGYTKHKLVTEWWYLHKHIPCKYLTEDSVYLQHNVTLYIQKSVSENARNAALGVEKYYYYIRPHTKLFVTNNLLSSLHTQDSMVPFFILPPPPPPPLDEIVWGANKIRI
jgi:hypothetical protein